MVAFALMFLAGAALASGATIAKGYADSNQAKASAEIATNNSKIQDYNAAQSKRRLEQDKKDTQRKYASILGTQTAQSGLLGGGLTGSTSDILDDQFGQQLDEMFRITKEREQEIYNFEAQSAEAKGRSSMLKSSAKASVALGWLGGSGQLLGAAASAGASGGFGGGSSSAASVDDPYYGPPTPKNLR